MYCGDAVMSILLSSKRAVSHFEIASDKRISQHLSGWTIAIVSAHFALTHEFS
jgi:hypothetical protein